MRCCRTRNIKSPVHTHIRHHIDFAQIAAQVLGPLGKLADLMIESVADPLTALYFDPEGVRFSARRVFPPLNHGRGQVYGAEGTTYRPGRSPVLMHISGIFYHLSLLRLCPAVIPEINGMLPGQPGEKMRRTGVRIFGLAHHIGIEGGDLLSAGLLLRPLFMKCARR